jgi:hypothetical protein
VILVAPDAIALPHGPSILVIMVDGERHDHKKESNPTLHFWANASSVLSSFANQRSIQEVSSDVVIPSDPNASAKLRMTMAADSIGSCLWFASFARSETFTYRLLETCI